MNWIYMLSMMLVVIVYTLIDSEKRFFGRFNFKNRKQKWIVSIGILIIGAIIFGSIEELISSIWDSQMTTDIASGIMFGLHISIFSDVLGISLQE